MTDQERILRLLEDGRITREQAEELLEALDEADSSTLALVPLVEDLALRQNELAKRMLELDRNSATALEDFSDIPKAEIIDGFVQPVPPVLPTPPTPPLPPAREQGQSEQAKSEQTASNDVPHDLTWITVKAVSGDVTIRVDPTITTPTVEGDDGPLPVYMPENGKGNLSIESLDEDLDITLPKNYGVILDVPSGDVEVEGCYVTGEVLSGDVSLRNVPGISLAVTSGDVDGSLKLQKGTHKLETTSGDVSLTFLKGSSLTFQGNVSSGDVSIRSPGNDFQREDMPVAFEGRVNQGVATLSLEVYSGDLDIDIKDDSSSVTTTSRATKKSKSDKNFEFNLEFDFSSANNLAEPKNLRWLAIRSLSGNVLLKTEPGLREPKVLNGKRLKQKDNGEYGIYSLMGNVEVVLPEDYGVRFDVMAGNLEARDVAYVKGRVWAGNAKLDRVCGVIVMSGNAEADVFLTEHKHNLEVWAGNAKVELVSGSSVVANATVPVGDVYAKTSNIKYEPLENKSFRATMGEGKAQLNLLVKAGNLEFRGNNV
jgi:hypothetical protein